MKRDPLFEKLEIVLTVEMLILLFALMNAPSANAKPADHGVKARLNPQQFYFHAC